MRFNSKFDQFYNMIMESFRDPNDPYEDDDHDRQIAGIIRNAKNPAVRKGIRKEFERKMQYVDLNDPKHVERLKNIVQNQITSFDFPPGKRVSPAYAYQKTLYEMEKELEKFFKKFPDSKRTRQLIFTFDEFTKTLQKVIHDKVYN